MSNNKIKKQKEAEENLKLATTIYKSINKSPQTHLTYSSMIPYLERNRQNNKTHLQKSTQYPVCYYPIGAPHVLKSNCRQSSSTHLLNEIKQTTDE